MLEKISQFAEQTAMNASRRQFLGRFGRAAAVAAGAMGGLLFVPGEAQAGRKCHGQICSAGAPYCCKEFDRLCNCQVWYCSSVPCPG